MRKASKISDEIKQEMANYKCGNFACRSYNTEYSNNCISKVVKHCPNFTSRELTIKTEKELIDGERLATMNRRRKSLRKVEILKYKVIDPEVRERVIEKEHDFNGWFHAWGDDFLEIGDVVAQLTIGIVELEDGSIKNVPTELIRFKN